MKNNIKIAFCFLALLFVNPAFSQVLESDSLALVSLYQATEGESWKEPWELFRNIKKWKGVTLDKAGKRVIALKLDKNNLKGELPASIGQLAALQNLNLSHNKWRGKIPEEIGNLASLKTLNLYGGLITSSFGSVGNTSFNMVKKTDYGFEGEVPKSVGKLSQCNICT